MTDSVSYRVEHRNGCRLVFGEVPMREMSALLMCDDHDEMVDVHLGSVIGATVVIGTPEALAELLEADDLPVNPQRVSERNAAMSASLPEAFCEWLYTGERGASSDYIAHCVTGIPAQARLAVPHDSGDFKRCLGVIEALREHASESDALALMGKSSEPWQNLAENWGTLKDMASKSGSQCSSFMKTIFRKGDDG